MYVAIRKILNIRPCIIHVFIILIINQIINNCKKVYNDAIIYYTAVYYS